MWLAIWFLIDSSQKSRKSYLVWGFIRDSTHPVTLRKKCPYSEFFWSAFSRIRTIFRSISTYFNPTEYGKIRIRKTPNRDSFQAVRHFWIIIPYLWICIYWRWHSSMVLSNWVLQSGFTNHCQIQFSITDFFCKCDQIRSFLRIWFHLLKKSVMENFIFLCREYSLYNSF